MLLEEKEIYEFGPFRLDIAEHSLSRVDGVQNGSLPEKSFQTLCFLVRNHGHLLSKRKLLDQVWGGAFVEENNLDKCIHAIRHALGERPGEQKFIETVRKHGYRFVADVRQSKAENEAAFPDKIRPQNSKPANAYQAYQLSRFYYNKLTFPDLANSRVWLEEAVHFDDNFAPAHAALAEQWVMEAITGLHAPSESFPMARTTLRRASDLELRSAEFYAVAGFVDLICDWNFVEAERNLRRSLELNSHHAFANKYLGEVLMFQRRAEEADLCLRRALEIEPMSLHIAIILTISCFLARNYQATVEECQKMLEIYPRFPPAIGYRCLAMEQMGRAAEAIDEYEKVLYEPGGEIVRRWMGYAYALVGEREKALETAAKLDAEKREHYLSPTHQALIFIALQEIDRAYFYLEQGIAERDPWMLWLAADPRFDSLRSDPRFDELVKRLGLK